MINIQKTLLDDEAFIDFLCKIFARRYGMIVTEQQIRDSYTIALMANDIFKEWLDEHYPLEHKRNPLNRV